MATVTIDGWCGRPNYLLRPARGRIDNKCLYLCGGRDFLGARTRCGLKFSVTAFASRKSAKKVKRDGQKSSKQRGKDLSEKRGVPAPAAENSSTKSEYDNVQQDKAPRSSITIASRSDVLRACTVTSGLIALVGLVIRQGSHIASMAGLPIRDFTLELPFGLENSQHVEMVVGLVIFVSSSRFLLLKVWPDFAESSDAANKQVLTSLEPLDYLIVAFLPGIAEELLFRGALLPLFGTNWTGVFLVAAIFGVLHVGNGRNYSFALWATFVGVVYGYTAVLSSSLLVAMASHSLNNLAGGVLWRFKTSVSSSD